MLTYSDTNQMDMNARSIYWEGGYATDSVLLGKLEQPSVTCISSFLQLEHFQKGFQDMSNFFLNRFYHLCDAFWEQQFADFLFDFASNCLLLKIKEAGKLVYTLCWLYEWSALSHFWGKTVYRVVSHVKKTNIQTLHVKDRVRLSVTKCILFTAWGVTNDTVRAGHPWGFTILLRVWHICKM